MAGALVSSGTAGRSLKLVAIGDSLPYGQFDCNNCATFVDLFGKAIARHAKVIVTTRNLSEHTGINSSDLRRELQSSAALRSAVKTADAITLTIGHNDQPWNRDDDSCDGNADPPNWKGLDAACAKATALVYGRNLEAILRSIRGLRVGKPTILRVTNDYNDLIGDPTVPKFFYAASKPFYDAYSALTCRLARKYGATCIDTYHAFNGLNGQRDAGSLLAGDHTHPSARGHRVIAQLLEQAGYQPLFP
jgi:lysophospholipase L1-like esterase